jgi:GH18 family chitinase
MLLLIFLFVSTFSEKRVIGYLPNWDFQIYRTLDYSALTHVFLAFINPDSNGNLSHGFGSDSTFNQIINTFHSNNVKVIASLGGAGLFQNYPTLAGASRRDEFNDKLIAFATKFNLDGYDLDIEGDAPDEFRFFVSLL